MSPSNRHVIESDEISDPSGIMSGTVLEPIVNAAAAKAAMGIADQVQADYTQANSSAADFVKHKPASRSQSSVSHSIVTTTASTGFQVSSTRDASVSYTISIVTTATIAGSQSGTVFLEIAATSSVTPADWTEVCRASNGQALSLAVALQSVQTTAAVLHGYVPGGYYARIRSLNVAGTPTFTYSSGQEVLL